MKIASYNIWNKDVDYKKRMALLIDLIKYENFDLLSLQEVRDETIVNQIMEECGYSYIFWKQYINKQEGLAILSKYELTEEWINWDGNQDNKNSRAMGASCIVDGKKIAIMNVHLDYRLASNREEAMVNVIQKLEDTKAEFKLLMGDFNSAPDSSVHRFLCGQQSLNGANTGWIDLGEAYSCRNKKSLEATFDFINNPRWTNDLVLYKPERYDWIMMENPFPRKCPVLKEYRLIGKEEVDGITPSDHYGVTLELDFL